MLIKRPQQVRNGIGGIFSQEFFRSGAIQWALVASIILNAANWLVLLFFIRKVDFPIILHYNVYFGVDLIGAWWQVYFLPLIGAMIIVLNTILGFVFYKQKERIITHLLMLAAVICQIAVAIAVGSIVRINY